MVARAVAAGVNVEAMEAAGVETVVAEVDLETVAAAGVEKGVRLEVTEV